MKKYIILLILTLILLTLAFQKESLKIVYAQSAEGSTGGNAGPTSTGCNVCATWSPDCQNKSLTCTPPGGAAGSGTACTNTCTSLKWDDPCGTNGITCATSTEDAGTTGGMYGSACSGHIGEGAVGGKWKTCVLDCNRFPSEPSCASCNLPSQYLTPDLGAACTNCIANSTSSTGWNARGAIDYVKTRMGTAYTGCTDRQVVNYMCNGGVSEGNKADCLGSKNGVCASACGGSGTPGTGSYACTANYVLNPSSPGANSNVTVTFSPEPTTPFPACVVLYQDGVDVHNQCGLPGGKLTCTINSGAAGSSHTLQVKYGVASAYGNNTAVCGNTVYDCNTKTYQTGGSAGTSRPSLCQLAAISGSTLNRKDSLTITSTAKISNVKEFWYAFYNLDNLESNGTPKGIYFDNLQTQYIIKVPGNSTNTAFTPVWWSDENHPGLGVNRPDLNWNSQMPKRIQVNAYFIDQSGGFSLPEEACVVSFNIQQQTPGFTTNTQFRIAENPTDLNSAPWQDYTGDGMIVDHDFKTTGQKFIFVQFKDSNNISCGTQNYCSAQITVLEPTPTPAASTSPTSSATPTPSPVFTTKFRIAENPTDLKVVPWQDYTTTIESTPFDYPIKDIAPGVKTIFVEFMDSTGKTGGCGNNQNQPCQKQIKLLGPDPTMTSCSLGFEGSDAILNLKGQNFGSDKGIVKSGDSDLQIKSWKDGSIQAVLQNAPTGQVLPVTFTNTDGQTGTGQCSSISQLSLGAKVFCRAPASYDTDNVDLVLVDETGKKMRQTVKIDKNGVVQGLTQRLEDGKKYTLSLKAPKSLRRTVTFTAGGGTVNLPNFILPIGDIFPLDGGDGTINALDKAELNREWNISGDATGRPGDFNQDGKINSIDWACMRYDYGCSDDPEAVSTQMSFTPSCPNASPNPSSSPSPSVSPSPSPSASSSPSPSP